MREHEDQFAESIGWGGHITGGWSRPVDPDPVLTPRDAEKTAPMKPLERVRRCFRVPTPRIHYSPSAEVRFEGARVRLAETANGLENLPLEHPQRRRLPRVQQLPYRPRQKAICIEVVLLHVE